MRTRILALSVIALSSLAARPAYAGLRPIEQALIEYYDLRENRADELSSADCAELEAGLADELSLLPAVSFNDVIGHLLVDYRHFPLHRAPIEGLLTRAGERIEPELRDLRQRSTLYTVIDDIFSVWTAAYVFGFGRGIWVSRGRGLSGLSRFREIVTKVAFALPKSRQARVGITAIGGSVALAHLIHDTLATRRLDPRGPLFRVQDDLVADAERWLKNFESNTALEGANQTESDLVRLSQLMVELKHIATAEPRLGATIHPLLLRAQSARISR